MSSAEASQSLSHFRLPIADWYTEGKMTPTDSWSTGNRHLEIGNEINLKDEGPLACKLFRLEVTDWRQKQLG